MKIMTRLLFLGCLFSLALSVSAQKVSFNDVIDVRLQNMGPILEENEVKGYYMFYKVDKVDRKNNAYLLRILDENLEEIGKKRFTKTKHTVLTEAVYNQKAFLFSFLDAKQKKLQLVTYDRELNRLGGKSYELDKWGISQFTLSNGAEEAANKMIFPIGDQGFVRYSQQKNKKLGYTIEVFSNDLKRTTSFRKSSPKDSKTVQIAGFGDANDRYLVSNITTKPKLRSNKDIGFHIQVLDLESQKVVFKKVLKSGRYQYTFMRAHLDKSSNHIFVFGEYFDKGDNIIKDRSKGLFALEYDLEGEVIKKEHHSWASDIGKKIGTNKKGRIEGGGYVTFHKIIRTEDGHTYAIGEMYKKAADGAGIALNVLANAAAAMSGGGVVGAGGVSMTKMVTMDMIIFELNPDLSLNDVQIFEKANSDFGLPQGYAFMPPTTVAYIAKAWGAFDYNYTQLSRDESSFFTTFTSTERDKKKKRRDYFGIIAHTDGDEDYVVDKIDLSTDASSISVYPAKPGYILLTEYYRKEKKLESRLEKINY